MFWDKNDSPSQNIEALLEKEVRIYLRDNIVADVQQSNLWNILMINIF